ncbi:MAG TPA: hypothetical protein VHZ81_04265 [Galbitalea sp.]|jgi:hypothetical protein|nr:hypothetical protein [Galbitalea sp.]
MTIDANHVAEEPASVSVGFPVTVGWTHAAIAVYSVLRLNTPVNLTMLIEMHGPLLIDFRHHAFSWSTPLELFPVDAVHTNLETEPVGPDDPPYIELPGQDLDGLLWEMGLNSFGGAAAYWLPPNERYKLTRWPNITRHAHNLGQMKMMAALANTYASTTELAALAGVEESEAQRLINALSLMRIIWRSADAPAAPVVKETAAAKRQSLFARLRKRLGR